MDTATNVQQEIKVEVKKTEKDYSAIFDEYYHDFNVKGKHDLFESKTHTGKSQQIGRIKRPIFRVELTGCVECGHPVKVYDPRRGETVCEKCGLVIDEVVFEDPGNYDVQHAPLPKINDNIRSDEQKLFKNGTKPRTPSATWRKQQYINTLMIIASQLQMNKNQIEIIKEVIETYKMTMFHRGLGHKTIIAALCRYILSREGRGRELRYSRTVFKENNLTKNKYETIAMNIQRLRIFGH